nr:nucleotide-binding alpha-beta plait domain-containing protein [Tanacetum cinerariifolium]
MESYRSKEDDVARISTSIYVTKFPDSFSAKDLFHLCKQCGHVVDSFIPIKRSKKGKIFGFVRFINVFNEERLINNLCTVWSGRFKLQANIAIFQRTPVNGNMNFTKDEGEFMGKNSHMNKKDNENSVAKEPAGRGNTYVQVVKWDVKTGGRETESIPVVFLDDECLMSNDFSMSLLGRVKEFASLANLKVALCNEGFVNIKIKYMGELWHPGILSLTGELHGWKYRGFHLSCGRITRSSELRIGKNILESFKIIHRGKAHWIRTCETPGWVLDFTDESDDEDQEDDMSNDEGAKEHIPGGGGMVTNSKIICNDADSSNVVGDNNATVKVQRVNTIYEANEGSVLLIVVYAPQEVSEKRLLWDYLQSEICKWNGKVVIMGDFNEVRYKSDRYRSKFNAHSAMVFNLFILNSGLVEVSLGGCSFTWCHKTTAKMSKLDRFLVFGSFLNSCPNINAITLERYLSDHRSILLRDAHVDYGPTPFRFFHYWLEMEGFAKMVEDGWRDSPCDRSNALRNLTRKLKHLKNSIRVWNKTKGNSNRDAKAQLKLELKVVDLRIDNGNETVEDIKRRGGDC